MCRCSYVARFACLLLLSPLVLQLAACGGGGSGAGQVSNEPVTSPGSAPAQPAPSAENPAETSGPDEAPIVSEPTVGTGFDTAEYRFNYGLDALGAGSAYSLGFSGLGALIASIDTGVDVDHPDLVGAIDPRSTDINDARGTLDDERGHGTWVAGLLAAARNEVGMHGVAYDASLLAIRAEAEDDACAICGSTSGVYFTNALAEATRYATTNDADIISFSLSGGGGTAWTEALEEATAAGKIVVLAAGNGRGEQPDTSALFALSPEALGRAIIVGASTDADQPWSENNQAGDAASVYLLAPGVDVVSTDISGGTSPFLAGSSFAVPHVAGALALLQQAFPNLAPETLVALLLDTARSTGAGETVEGRGLIDLEAAFSPQGAAILPTGTQVGAGVALDRTGVTSGAAFGDSLSGAGVLSQAIFLDGYGRAFRTDLRHGVQSDGAHFDLADRLGPMVEARSRHDMDVLGFRLESRFSDAGFRDWSGHGRSFREQVDSLALSAPLGAATRVQFASGAGAGQFFGVAKGMTATGYLSDDAFRSPHAALTDGGHQAAIEQEIGDGFGLRAGFAIADDEAAGDQVGFTDVDGARMAVRAELFKNFASGARIGLQFGDLREEEALLATRGAGGFALDGAGATRFVGFSAAWPIAERWTVLGHASLGWSNADGASDSLIEAYDDVRSEAFGLGLARAAVLAPGDRLHIAASQPLRVGAGSATVDVPVAMHATGEIERRRAQVDLEPSGRQIDIELGYGRPLGSQDHIRFGVIGQLEPGHDADAGPDLAAFVAWRRAF